MGVGSAEGNTMKYTSGCCTAMVPVIVAAHVALGTVTDYDVALAHRR